MDTMGDAVTETGDLEYHLATMVKNAHTKVKLSSGKTCTFLVWLIWQPGYEILQNISIADRQLGYTTDNENSSLVFLKQAAETAAAQMENNLSAFRRLVCD